MQVQGQHLSLAVVSSKTPMMHTRVREPLFPFFSVDHPITLAATLYLNYLGSKSDPNQNL